MNPSRWLSPTASAPHSSVTPGARCCSTIRRSTRIAEIERDIGPRWVWWTADTATTLVGHGIRPARCSNLEAVHRLLMGGWRAGPGRVWAAHRGLDPLPDTRRTPPDLFSPPDDDDPIRSDGHLNPAWIDGQWRADLAHLHRWAVLALEVHRRQHDRLEALADRPAAAATARSESAATLLCAELEPDGLPIDVHEAERIIASFIGPRPIDAADDRRITDERDRKVLRHLDGGADTTQSIDLRNPASVKSLLRRVGIEVPDTRAWRLEQIRDEHPLVDDLLEWRRAERIATTFGYRWLDQHVGTDRRLRGQWSSSDGAAGRMTATAGLHNLPAELRPAVVAETGHVFVRADLGQIEPRILAAISGDAALTAATVDDDMYAPVAARLGVSRDVAKVAVLGAMYGQTTGLGASALRGWNASIRWPWRTSSGPPGRPNPDRISGPSAAAWCGCHRIPTISSLTPGPTRDRRVARSRAAARGRYGRNAMVQGAAAEFFKTWAVIVRARLAGTDAAIVLCLHDELLVHAPLEVADAARESLDNGLQEAAHRWEPAGDVRFVTETSVITRWSDAK